MSERSERSERSEATGAVGFVVMSSGAPVDVAASQPVRRSVLAFRGGVVAVRVDHVEMPDGDLAVRDVLLHPGSVGIIALDGAGQVLILSQYRHPVGRRLWEFPAGLLDSSDELRLVAAQRELAEEAGLCAADWRVLLDAYTSPGISDETVRIFVARELSPVGGEPAVGRHEEFDLELRWVGLDVLVAGVLRGELHNPLVAMGAPALQAVLAGSGIDSLRAGSDTR